MTLLRLKAKATWKFFGFPMCEFAIKKKEKGNLPTQVPSPLKTEMYLR